MSYSLANETIEERKARTQQVINILKKTYPQAKIALRFGNPWELLVAVVLSAQCTDKMVNKVTEELFKKYSTLDDYVSADLAEFEQDIKSTGFYKNKAKNIQAAAQIILDKHSGKVPRTMDGLTSLHGVARKTANIILGNAYNIVEGIAVDTHVQRISQRLRLVNLEAIGKGKERRFKKNDREIVDFKTGVNTDKIEQQLMQIIPKEDWFNFTYLVIDHGRAICTAQKPKCPQCPLNKLCPASRV